MKYEKYYMGLIKFLPKKLVSTCGIYIIAEATSDKYGNTVPVDLSCMDAIERFDLKHNVWKLKENENE